MVSPQSQNPYSYALNNPINLSDPSGEQSPGVSFIQWCIRAATTVGTKVSSLFQKTAPATKVTDNVKYSENQLTHFQKIFEQGGTKSLLKSRESIGENLIEHQQKLQLYKSEGGYTSSVETEISNFQRELNAIDEVLRMNK